MREIFLLLFRWTLNGRIWLMIIVVLGLYLPNKADINYKENWYRLLMPRLVCTAFISGICMLLLMSCSEQPGSSSKDWPKYGGNNAGNRYSELTQITAENVNNLSVVWKYSTTDSASRRRRIECQPIVIDGILYGTGARSELFALDAATGRELWKFQPPSSQIHRGINYWEEGDDQRIFYVIGSFLYGIDASTGKLIKELGNEGKVDFHAGLENDRFDVQAYSVTATSPGVIYEDILVLGSTVSEFGDALPGDIRGFDVRSGKLIWVFHTIPQPGEFGYDTWPEDAYKKIGGANNWAGMVLDDKRGIVYLGTGSPSADFYGGDRHGENLFGNCILALDARTGKRKWHFQTISHDLWDLDIACPPNLTTVDYQGKLVDVLVQTTKDGLIYVLDRDTGKSLFPIEERPVPTTGGLPGEKPHPTQKFPLKPLPLVTRQVITITDLPDSIIFPDTYKAMKAEFLKTRHGAKYIPPSKEGFWYIGTGGGALWGGNAIDPDGTLYQNVSELPSIIEMKENVEKLKDDVSYGNSQYLSHCSGCHGSNGKGDGSSIPDLMGINNRLSENQLMDLLKSGRGRMPSFQHLRKSELSAIVSYIFDKDSEYPMDEVHARKELEIDHERDFPYIPPYTHKGWNKVIDANGYPGIKPPWGTLNAVDLNTGEYLWRVPLGEHEELSAKGIPVTGTVNRGGPIVTSSGLIFIAATKDEFIRAFDRNTGEVLWKHQLGAPGYATPITYSVGGKQFIVIATSGKEKGENQNVGGEFIAFSLP